MNGAWLTPSIGLAVSAGRTTNRNPASTAPNSTPTPEMTALEHARRARTWSPNVTACDVGVEEAEERAGDAGDEARHARRRAACSAPGRCP